MEQISVSCGLVVTVMCFVCIGLSSVVMCSEPSDALIKTYVSSSLPSNDDSIDSAMLKVPQIRESAWDQLVIKSKLPVMVMFVAAWSGPCRLVRPRLAALASSYAGRFNFYTLDVDDDPNIAEAYAIPILPTTIVFKDGHQVDRCLGADLHGISELVRKYV